MLGLKNSEVGHTTTHKFSVGTQLIRYINLRSHKQELGRWRSLACQVALMHGAELQGRLSTAAGAPPQPVAVLLIPTQLRITR